MQVGIHVPKASSGIPRELKALVYSWVSLRNCRYLRAVGLSSKKGASSTVFAVIRSTRGSCKRQTKARSWTQKPSKPGGILNNTLDFTSCKGTAVLVRCSIRFLSLEPQMNNSQQTKPTFVAAYLRNLIQRVNSTRSPLTHCGISWPINKNYQRSISVKLLNLMLRSLTSSILAFLNLNDGVRSEQDLRGIDRRNYQREV